MNDWHNVLIPLPVCVIICGLLGGCREQQADALVTVNGRAITQADFDDEASRRPGMSAEAVLTNLIERQAMLIRAEASGVADTPVFKRDMENKLISEWLANTYRKDRDAVTITEEELQAAYEARREQLFSRPPLTRYAILYRKGSNTDELVKALSDALARFESDRDGLTNNGRIPGFGKISSDSSEDTVSRYRGGDIGWVGDETVSRIPAEVLVAGKALDVGAVAGPMPAGDGVYAIMKTAERDTTQIGFKEAAPALRGRLVSEKQAAVEARFKESLMGGVSVVHKAKPVAQPARKREDVPPALPLPMTD